MGWAWWLVRVWSVLLSVLGGSPLHRRRVPRGRVAQRFTTHLYALFSCSCFGFRLYSVPDGFGCAALDLRSPCRRFQAVKSGRSSGLSSAAGNRVLLQTEEDVDHLSVS
jgi:hypothetical protein